MSKLCLAALVAVVAWPAAAHGASARTCDIHGKERKLGATYVTSLSVRHTSCSTGKAVVRAFNKCRKGPRGHCHHRVKHFKCTEHRRGIAVQFNSTVNCTRGSRRVHFTYTQNT